LEVHVIDDLAIVAPDAAGVANVATDSPNAGIYRVRKHDSLSTIAEKAYGRQLWSEIYRANRVQIREPDLIFPDQLLILPPKSELPHSG